MKPIPFLQPLLGLCLLAASALPAQAATLTVLNNTDTGTDSLRGRIAAATAGDTIIFDASLNGATITLGGTNLTIAKNLIIDASALTGGITIDGNGASQVFLISTFEVELRKLVITGGGNEAYGAGIGSYGDLTLTDCTISGNTSTFRGGGIWSHGALTATGCTISGNRASGLGGGIGLGGSFLRPSGPVATFTNCTISGNQTPNAGTVFYMDSGGVPGFTLTLDHCTVSMNQADDNGSDNSAIYVNGNGQITVRNSIIAGNSPNLGHPDFYYGGSGVTWTIEGVNIIGNNATVGTQFPATAGLVGTNASPVNPLLGTLANNGGPTQTMAPQAGSPAIDAASGTSPSTDQRGFSRNGAADIGAFEVQSSNANLASLVLSEGTLDPSFASATETYTASTAAATSSLTVTPTAENNGATITVNGSPVSSGAASGGITLNPGAGNIVTVVVTAQDQVATKTYTINVTRLPATTDGNGNGFTDLEEFYLADVPTAYRVGDQVSIDIGSAMPSRTLAVTGLPRGLTFDPGTRLITGTILGELGDADVTIQIKVGRTVIGSFPFAMSVAPYPYLGGWQALIEDGTDNPVGQVHLTVTGPRAATAVLELAGAPKRSIKTTAIVFGPETIPVQPVTLSFPAGKNLVPAATTVVMNLSSASDLFAGTENTINSLRGFRLGKPGRTSSRKVTVAFENGFAPGDRSISPQGTGYATGALSTKGLLSLGGALGDAQKLTLALYPSQTNHAVVWAQPYKDKAGSYFGGVLEVGDLDLPERGQPRQLDIDQVDTDGVGIQWKKASSTVENKSYANGFGPLIVNGEVSKWTPVLSVEALSLSLGLNLRELYSGFSPADLGFNPAPALPTKLSLRGGFSLARLLPTATVPWRGKAVPSSGTFSGSLKLTGATGTTVNGVLLQDERFGTQIGAGVVKIPTVTLVKGSFDTAGIRLEND